jgi:hypothetical protein
MLSMIRARGAEGDGANPVLEVVYHSLGRRASTTTGDDDPTTARH